MICYCDCLGLGFGLLGSSISVSHLRFSLNFLISSLFCYLINLIRVSEANLTFICVSLTLFSNKCFGLISIFARQLFD